MGKAPMNFGVGLLVLDGMLTRRVGLDGRFGAELLGAGDLLRPWQSEDSATTMPHASGWQVLQPMRAAVLDADFTIRMARYPEVVSALFGRALRRSRRNAVLMAIVHQPRTDVRLHMLFWELADRWGTVHREGVKVPVRLTHRVLAELIAARRPTVSKALGELAERGSVRWVDGAWLLNGPPPSELRQVGDYSLASSAMRMAVSANRASPAMNDAVTSAAAAGPRPTRPE
jgi:CRP-like cAMP-binding protein